MDRSSQPRDRLGQLLAAFLVCAGLAAIVFGIRYYGSQKREFEQAARDKLAAVADLKVAQIHEWRDEILGDANWILQGSLLAGDARRFFADPTDAAARERLTVWLVAWQRHQSCAQVRLVDTAGEGRLAAPEASPGLEARSRDFAARAAKEGSVLIADLHLREGTADTVALEVFVPVVERAGGDGSTVGVLVIEIDPRAFLFPMIEAWPTPSTTAETLLVRRDGDEAVYLNELRHRKGTALRLRVPLTQRTMPSVKAVLGEEGVAEGIDYRGMAVLAATRTIPDSPWCIVAKQDQAEILAPLHRQAWTTGIIVGALLLAILAGLTLLWRRRERFFTEQELAERTASENRLQASEERFRSLFTAMNEGAVLHELVRGPDGTPTDYRIVECNPAFAHNTGIPAAQARGALASVLYGTTPPPFLARYAEVATTGSSQTFETEYAPLGRHFHISVFSPGKDRFATVFQDITGRRRTEEERATLLADLKRVNAELERLIYVASHDLRSPLVNLQGFGQRLEKSCAELTELLRAPELPAALHEPVARIVGDRIPGALKYIRTSIDKMESLIGGLLKVSRLGHAEMAVQRLDMDRLVRDVIAAQTFQIQATGADVQAEPLPAGLGDAVLLNQVFSNLLDNALKYRDPARPARIRFSGQIEDGRAVYTVADNGVGIAPEHQARIWEMFHRLHPEGGVAGEGLGLNLARRILDRHRGRIWMESAPGQGSRFFVSLAAG